jgi:hypothetical protein
VDFYLRKALAGLSAVLQVQGRHSVGSKEEHLAMFILQHFLLKTMFLNADTVIVQCKWNSKLT